MQNENKGFFDSLNPKTSFIFGLLAAIGISSIFGIIFILVSGGSGKASNNSVVVNPSPSAPSPTAPTPTRPTGNKDALPPVTDQDHIRGDVNAPLTIVEYSDFECPFCKRFHPTMMQVLDEFDGKVKWVYRHFPLSFHPAAQPAAEGSECAAELGGNDSFWAFSDEVFNRMPGVTKGDLPKIASDVGLDQGKFEECLNSGKYSDLVQQQLREGSTAGVTGTPGSFLVDGDGNIEPISGAVPFETIKSAIEAAL